MKYKFAILFSLATFGSAMQSAHAYGFGDDWKIAGTQCKVLDAKKKLIKWAYKKHVGADHMQAAGTKVIVTGNLYFYKKHTDSGGVWKDHVTACTLLNAKGICDATNNKNIFYDFLHLNSSPLKAGQSLKDVQIGTVADLTGNGGSHVHYTKRNGAWSDSISYSGALPPKECNDAATRKGPNYPENFVDPGTPLFIFKKK